MNKWDYLYLSSIYNVNQETLQLTFFPNLNSADAELTPWGQNGKSKAILLFYSDHSISNNSNDTNIILCSYLYYFCRYLLSKYYFTNKEFIIFKKYLICQIKKQYYLFITCLANWFIQTTYLYFNALIVKEILLIFIAAFRIQKIH